jgi:hypothetical protein
MSDGEVEQKFRKLCEGGVPRERCESILNAVRALKDTQDIGELLDLIRIEG